MLASLATGSSEISGFLPSGDCQVTVEAFKSMGVHIARCTPTRLRIQGVGINGLRAPGSALQLGNSGTAMRLMAGILCAQNFPSTLIGDDSLSARPMRRIQTPLQNMGAHIVTSAAGTPPLQIQPVAALQGIHYALPVASAQVKSCILLAGLYARGTTCVAEHAHTRDHTERMLQTFSYPLQIHARRVCLHAGEPLIAANIKVPGDLSSAAFFIVGALLSPAAELIIEGVGVNPTRDGIITILRHMGGDIQISNAGSYGAEPVADLLVRNSPLHGINIPPDLMAKSIDEFPVLCIAAAHARGVTTIRGVAELRVKESDRIHNVAVGLQRLGIKALEKPDGIVIVGGDVQGGNIDSGGDHRVAMAFAMASIISTAAITIEDVANVATSFPDFAAVAARAGLTFT